MTDQDILEADRILGAPHPRNTQVLRGQMAAEQIFLEAYNNTRLHHGWLIAGPKGIGKATLAWKIIRFLLSRPIGNGPDLLGGDVTPTSLETSTDHPVVQRLAALSEPGLMLVRRPWDHKAGRLKKNITVDEIRKLKTFFSLSAADGGRRIVLIDAADEMNTSAANALLKILEEPPKNAILLLISHQPSGLLPTIRSRCRVLNCATLGPDDLALSLNAAGCDDIGNFDAVVRLANGSVGEAMHLVSQNGLDLYAALLALLEAAPKMDRTAMLTLANSCVGKSAEARYDLTLRLISILLGRMAKSGVSKDLQFRLEDNERAVMAKKCGNADQARRWAKLEQDLAARASHGQAVNLDPATVILDMLVKLNQAAA